MISVDNTALTKERATAIVRERLAKHCLTGATLRVVEEATDFWNGYWHVLINPSVSPPDSVEYVRVLANLEGELQDDLGLDIILHPGDPDVSSPN